MFGTLQEFGWIYRTSEKGPWRATQRAVGAGWLVHRTISGTYERSDGRREAMPPQVRVTKAGLLALHARMSRAHLELVVGESG